MPFNGQGTFEPLPEPTFPAIGGEVILAAAFNAIIRDLISGLSASLTKNGEGEPTAHLPMAGFRHLNVGDALLDNQYATLGQVFPKRIVLAAVDWNNLKVNGFYQTTAESFNAGAGSGNFPADADGALGILKVHTVGGAIISQEYLTPNSYFLRHCVSNVWTAWSPAVPDGSVTVEKLADNALAATAAGRLKMADGFLTLAKLADGILSADAAGRLKMADGFLTVAKLAADFALPITQGGTGATSVTAARAALNVPSRTGADASGTWGISITGNAATADKLTGDPGNAPSFSPRAWVNFDGAGTIGVNQTIRASGNISSVLKNGIGDWTITFTEAMADAHYALAANVQDNQGGNYHLRVLGPPQGAPLLKTATQVRVGWSGDSGAADASHVTVIILR